MTIPLRIDPALTGSALHSDGALVTLHAPKAFPPGQPLSFVLWPDTPQALSLAGRAIGSKRLSDETFEVRVRLINVGRQARETLLATFREP